MDLKNIIKYFKESDSFWAGLLRDLVFVITVVVIFASVSKIALGLYTPMVAVESGSMIPHIQIGDIIFVESIDRTEIITNEAGKKLNYLSFDEYGDVILYKPRGMEGTTPIIHRAMYYINESEPMWPGGPLAPHAGYITKGDNSRTNAAYDQQGSISHLQPIKKEWVIGKARFGRVPLLGCISLIPRGNFACFK
ncbi:MAG: signal sequence peptidase [Candidatus Methanoperedens nitroreducens]|uniref:Signal sequence peptidase n=1 Tax=Candidatus Methanoperedens nitratireducens TaxID=1392998 RepID=A0A0P8A6Y3_9EURY|nr:signal peptidase I [Candidatus Methanoperedens sp. BLZ2]KAB2943416.1 MAG: signal peptidase I [Candidatus Methanoperedens sp.]KPQ43881.1 MAG: signal sequence peptidase [Candidatus Methanoperedens sp. BLZ1]MBZ0176437.1 signal peptidase I [Candidatus Methanoperedens nitroreducens]MCX9078630.1 signal peptidase I [Candidatus Methanoperedens sp.]